MEQEPYACPDCGEALESDAYDEWCTSCGYSYSTYWACEESEGDDFP